MNPFKQFWLNRRLVRAALKNDIEATTRLLDAGADPATKVISRLGMPLLHAALTDGADGAALKLTAAGSDAEALSLARVNALHLAALLGKTEMVRAFLDSGVPISSGSGNGQNALHWAVTSQHAPTVALLLERKITTDIYDQNGLTPLHYCASHEKTDIALQLIAAGAGLNALDNLGQSPLHHAAHFRNDAFARVLIDAGCDISIRTQVGNKTAYGIALMNAGRNVVAVIDPHEKKLQAERDAQWSLIEPKKVVRIYTEGRDGLDGRLEPHQITEFFNFATKRYKAFSKNMKTNAECYVTRGFGDMNATGESSLIDEARTEMKRLEKRTARPAAAGTKAQ